MDSAGGTEAVVQSALPVVVHLRTEDKTNRRSRSAQYAILVFLIVAASSLRVFVCFRHNPLDYLWSDPLRHWASGVRFPRGGYSGASDPILYQVYVAILYRLGGTNRFLVALASAILSVIMPWTYYRAAREFGLGKIAALWVWLLIACNPSLFTIYHYIMMETLLLFVTGLALWMTGRYLRKGGGGLSALRFLPGCWPALRSQQ